MARPRDQFYDKRRAVIADAAEKLISEQSFHGVSISDLADKCGMSKSVIYHYYDSKEDILFAVVSAHLEKLSLAASDIADADTSPREKLINLIRCFVHICAGATDRQKIVLNELGNLPADKRAEVISGQKRIISIVEEILSGLRSTADESPEHRRVMAILLFEMINRTPIWSKSETPLTANELAEMSGKLLLDGVNGLLCGVANHPAPNPLIII